jgi:acyl CoA:acetate/3-ketoacid CoA transferase alpha subunit
MEGMAKRKVTITLDSAKAEQARHLSGAKTTSGVIDLALDTLIRRKQIENDVAAYRQFPTTSEELLLASSSELPDLADETDWLALYDGPA